jgi:transcriptional regulator of met regulon
LAGGRLTSDGHIFDIIFGVRFDKVIRLVAAGPKAENASLFTETFPAFQNSAVPTHVDQRQRRDDILPDQVKDITHSSPHRD